MLILGVESVVYFYILKITLSMFGFHCFTNYTCVGTCCTCTHLFCAFTSPFDTLQDAHSCNGHTHTHTPSQGKLKYNEHVTDGFDNMFDAFMGLFKGDNVGKAVVKA